MCNLCTVRKSVDDGGNPFFGAATPNQFNSAAEVVPGYPGMVVREVDGSKTRTSFRAKDQPIFAWGGLWRKGAEWGAVYSGAMTDGDEAIRPVNDRIPNLLHPDEYNTWLNGSVDDLIAFKWSARASCGCAEK